MEQNILQVEVVPIDKLFCSPSNPRVNDPAVPHVAASLKRFGWQQPVVAKPSGEVIAGNTRLKAAQSLGLTEIPVITFVGADIDAVAYSIADNKSHEHSAWDDDALAKLLQQLKEEDSLEAVGFDDSEIDELLKSLEDGGQESGDIEDPGPEEPPEEPVSKLGDLWILGDHRLLCGDATLQRDVDRLMGDDRATLVATDPPYLVDYTGERPNDSGKDWSATYDEVSIKDADKFFRSTFENVLRVIAPKAAVYCWHAHKRTGVIQKIWEELGIVDHQQIIWVKPAPVFGRVYWHFKHEPCMMGWIKGSKPEHDGNHEFNSVWQVDYDYVRGRENEHPTQKPVELFARPMRKHTKKGDVCYEPFSGSGSQLVGAEQLGRRCRAMEISTAFVDVAVRRWQKATGKAALLDGDGRPFDEVSKERVESNGA